MCICMDTEIGKFFDTSHTKVFYLFYFILFYFILFYFILFYFIYFFCRVFDNGT